MSVHADNLFDDPEPAASASKFLQEPGDGFEDYDPWFCAMPGVYSPPCLPDEDPRKVWREPDVPTWLED